MKFQIPFWTGRASLEIDIPDDTPAQWRMRAALEIAVSNGASLVGARLDHARLDGASLVGARLDRASLDGANLVGARLNRARLVGASLDDARLVGASLDRASLDGARLDRASLVGARLDDAGTLLGERPVIQIGPIGSRATYLIGYVTNLGVRVRTGCFFGSLDEFRAAVAQTHGDGTHGREYAAAITMIEAHAALWTPPEGTGS